MPKKYDLCSSVDKVEEDDKNILRMPKKYLNQFGFINYDYSGQKPWNSCDEAKENIHLPPYMFVTTNILGLNCEMVQVGLLKINLGRISIVNAYGYCIYDTFVKPQDEVTSYRTKHTGIKAEDLENALDEGVVLKKVAEIVAGKTLVGHSFHNDLYALGLSNHPLSLIRDTAVYYKREMNTDVAMSLEDLISLKFTCIAERKEPNPIQNAQAVVRLYLLSREKWENDIVERREKAKLTFDPKSGAFAVDISEMHVAPTESDLFADSKKIFLRKNKVIGAYSSCAEYLDVQFRLLQEDFLIPLRELVKTVQERRQSRDALFQGVTILGNSKVRGPTVILIPIEGNNLKDLDGRESKIFMNGSLLLLTPDDFKTVKMATVIFRPKKNMHKRTSVAMQLRVKFSDDGPSWSHNNNSFLMMESPAFYDAYKHSLEYLRTVNLHLFPMKKYIVDAVTETEPPMYMKSVSKKLDFSVVLNSKEHRKAAPLDLQDWPTAEELNLDSSQFEAFQKAITQELTIIQGPPGTGKTFIGIQIVKLLLSNPWLLNSPILIVSYTNHALDQTLEYILDFITKELCDGDLKKAQQMILRIGGGTKSEVVLPLTLSFKVEKNAEKFMQMDHLDTLKKALAPVQDLNFEGLLIEHGILDFERLPKEILLKLRLNRDSFKVYEQWGRIHKQMQKNPINWFGLKESQNPWPYIEKEGLFIVSFDSQFKINFHERILAVRDQILLDETLEDSTFDDIALERKRNEGARWVYYFILVKFVKKIIEGLKIELEIVLKEMSELEHFLPESKCIKAAKVFGMTTSGAVKHKDTVLLTQPKLMIVEEAAHVLEAFVVTSLTEHCQQMVLIGDHKQLRPLTGDYGLATEYKFDISLMERLVKNGIDQGNQNWTQLKVQHRMRPEIARMVCPAIYKVLHNHPDVYNYPDVKGVNKNLFFVDHRSTEGREGGSNSYFNEYEADFLSGLANYLVCDGGYSPRQITIIATYLAQKTLIESKLQDSDACSSLRVSTVDCYQGEENDIILLSLVRNNYGNDVGFLSTDNRVCVALSRARHGLFIMGNMPSLKSRSTTWSKINAALVEMDSIGPLLPLTDENLMLKKDEVEEEYRIDDSVSCIDQYENCDEDFASENENHKAKSFPSRSDGNSSEESFDSQDLKMEIIKDNKIIGKGMDSSGQKMKRDDAEEYQGEPNVVVLLCGHTQISCENAYKVEKACKVSVIKKLSCGHQQRVECHQSASITECNVFIEYDLPCGHVKKVSCRENSSVGLIRCDLEVVTNLECGHQKKLPCYESESDVTCDIIVEKNLPCGHKMELPCENDVENIKCTVLMLPVFGCTHENLKKVPCCFVKSAQCSFCFLNTLRVGRGRGRTLRQDMSEEKTVGIKLCSHRVNNQVSEMQDICRLQCQKIVKCGHRCRFPCHESYDSEHLKYRCFENCQRSCSHGHPCPGDHLCSTKCHFEFNCYDEDTKTSYPRCQNEIRENVYDLMTRLKVSS